MREAPSVAAPKIFFCYYYANSCTGEKSGTMLAEVKWAKQMAKENKKFQWSKVKPGGRGETYMGPIQWLEDAGIICRCYNTDITGLPMEGNAKDNVFKVYTADIGLLIEMLGPGTRADILQGNLGGFKGAIYENLMADTLHKKQQSLYYFQKDSGLELDFLVRMKGECVPLEVKARTAQAKNVQTVLRHEDKYHVKHIIKFGDYNVGREGPLLTLPGYMQFLLDPEPEDIVLEPIDVDAVNALKNIPTHWSKLRRKGFRDISP